VGERRGAHRILVGKPEGKSPLGRPMHIWKDNIKIVLLEYVRAWTGLIWLKLVASGGIL
jgi:hypothetical protein